MFYCLNLKKPTKVSKEYIKGKYSTVALAYGKVKILGDFVCFIKLRAGDIFESGYRFTRRLACMLYSAQPKVTRDSCASFFKQLHFFVIT